MQLRLAQVILQCAFCVQVGEFEDDAQTAGQEVTSRHSSEQTSVELTYDTSHISAEELHTSEDCLEPLQTSRASSGMSQDQLLVHGYQSSWAGTSEQDLPSESQALEQSPNIMVGVTGNILTKDNGSLKELTQGTDRTSISTDELDSSQECLEPLQPLNIVSMNL